MKLNSSSMGLNDGEPCSPRLLETHTLLVEPPPSWSDSRRHSRVNERAISLPSSTTHDVRCTPRSAQGDLQKWPNTDANGVPA